MRRVLALFILAMLGFYVAWPAWSLYRINTALNASDAGMLDSKVDFPAVRESLRPAVTSEIEKRIGQDTQALGALGQVLGADARAKIIPKLVDQVLAAVVTPDRVIRIVHDGSDITQSINTVLSEAAGQMAAMSPASPGSAPAGGALAGVLGQILAGSSGDGSGSGNGTGSAPDLAAIAGRVLGAASRQSATPVAGTPAVKPATAKRTFGLGNIKGFAFSDPLAFNVAVARDAAQPKADGTFGMRFTDGDWKLTRVIPNL